MPHPAPRLRQPLPRARQLRPSVIGAMLCAKLALACGACSKRDGDGSPQAQSPRPSAEAQATSSSSSESRARSGPSAPGEDAGRAASTSRNAAASASAEADDEYREERERMVREQLAEQGIDAPRVLEAMRVVPRHRFVSPGFAELAYADRPLPIVGEQTISQPYIVAFMTQAADLSGGERCLEIGTGSGYQAAVLTHVCKQTYSIEYLPEVAAFGRGNLERTGYLARGLELRVGDGYAGWPEAAPFDAILVTAAPETVPQPLLDQLAIGGKLVIPVGPEHGMQRLQLFTRLEPGSAASSFEREVLFGVRFVPFLGPGSRRR